MIAGAAAPAAGAAQNRPADDPPPPVTITMFEGNCILDHNGYDPCQWAFPTVEHDDYTYRPSRKGIRRRSSSRPFSHV